MPSLPSLPSLPSSLPSLPSLPSASALTQTAAAAAGVLNQLTGGKAASSAAGQALIKSQLNALSNFDFVRLVAGATLGLNNVYAAPWNLQLAQAALATPVVGQVMDARTLRSTVNGVISLAQQLNQLGPAGIVNFVTGATVGNGALIPPPWTLATAQAQLSSGAIGLLLDGLGLRSQVNGAIGAAQQAAAAAAANAKQAGLNAAAQQAAAAAAAKAAAAASAQSSSTTTLLIAVAGLAAAAYFITKKP